MSFYIKEKFKVCIEIQRILKNVHSIIKIDHRILKNVLYITKNHRI